MICCDCFWHGSQLGCLFAEMMAAKRDVDDDETIMCGVSGKLFPRKIFSALMVEWNIKMSVDASGCEVKLLKLREEPRKCPFPRSVLSIWHAQLMSKLSRLHVCLWRRKQSGEKAQTQLITHVKAWRRPSGLLFHAARDNSMSLRCKLKCFSRDARVWQIEVISKARW